MSASALCDLAAHLVHQPEQLLLQHRAVPPAIRVAGGEPLASREGTGRSGPASTSASARQIISYNRKNSKTIIVALWLHMRNAAAPAAPCSTSRDQSRGRRTAGVEGRDWTQWTGKYERKRSSDYLKIEPNLLRQVPWTFQLNNSNPVEKQANHAPES